jgi:PAS domain S-box-containing protein
MLGQSAIRSRDLAVLLNEATAVAAETLGTEFAALGEWLPDGKGLRLRAGVGWREGFVGSTLAAEDAPLAMLLSDAPVVLADVRAASRFAVSQVTLEHGVLSAMGVEVRSRSEPWGVLAVHSTRRRSFCLEEVGFLQSVASVLSLAVERHEIEVGQRREKETLQAIFDNIPVMISITDTSERLWRVNREWERTLGWTLEEAQRVDLLHELYPDPENRKAVLEFYRRVQSRWADFPLRTRDHRAIEASWACFDISDGSRISLGLEITERKRAEEAMRESEARLRQLAENINEVFWLVDLDSGELLYVSPVYQRVFGRSLESLYVAPRSWLEAVHPEDRERVRRAADEKGARGELDETYRVVRADGSIRWVRDRGFPIRDAAGQTYRYAGIAEDITERRQADEERTRLLESERRARAETEMAIERLRAIESITELALARLGLDDLLSELLARLRKALDGDFACVQLIDEEQDNLTIRASDGVAMDLVAPVRVPIGQAVAGRIAADGRPRVVYDLSATDVSRIEGLPPELLALLRGSMLGTPLQVEGRVIGVLSVASAEPGRFTEEDLRLLQVVADRVAPSIERCRLDEAMRASREQLKALSRRLLTAQEEERRRLAVELHDELGQILTAVKINLESLERQSGAAATPAHLRDAITSVDRATETVRDLALHLRPSVLDDLGLPAAVRWYVDRFARSAGVEAHLSIDAIPDLSPEVQTACFRVAQEALTNVTRHAQARNVWVDLCLRAEGLELRVRDDGIGFDAGAAMELAIGGASMGLLGMQERVALLRGEYKLSSSPGGVTEVWARFPVGEQARGTS